MSDMGQDISLNRLVKERNSLVGKLAGYKHILRGTLVNRGNICGKPGCKCKRGFLHGPYYYLAHRSLKGANMIFLNKTKLPHAKKGLEEYKRLTELIYKVSEINFKILRYHYAKLKGKALGRM